MKAEFFLIPIYNNYFFKNFRFSWIFIFILFYREEEVLSDTDEDETNTNDPEEVIRARAEYEKSKENLAKIKRLYELAVSRLEEIENGVLSAYVATPEEVELDRYLHTIYTLLSSLLKFHDII
jgi:hypothetical protein